VRRSRVRDFFSLLFSPVFRFCFFFLPFFVLTRNKVKYFSPMTNLCIVRVARGTATNTTWAALALLDRVGGGGGDNSADGHKVDPHVIHVSGAS
jgi:hypothetical protein